MLGALLTRLATAATNCVDGSNACDTGLPQVNASHGQLVNILQLVLGVIAGVAVLFIVIGALRFVISEGDPQDTAKARYTMIYALVGLVIAVVAEGLVTFVLGRI